MDGMEMVLVGMLGVQDNHACHQNKLTQHLVTNSLMTVSVGNNSHIAILRIINHQASSE